MVRKRSTYVIGGAILLAFVAGFLISSYPSEPTKTVSDQMALYTWKGSSGDLCFLLIPMTQSGRARPDFWSKSGGQCGVANLKKALGVVSKGKSVEWRNWPGKFQYPSEEFCDEIIAFSNSKGVHLYMFPAWDAEVFTDWQPR